MPWTLEVNVSVNPATARAAGDDVWPVVAAAGGGELGAGVEAASAQPDTTPATRTRIAMDRMVVPSAGSTKTDPRGSSGGGGSDRRRFRPDGRWDPSIDAPAMASRRVDLDGVHDRLRHAHDGLEAVFVGDGRDRQDPGPGSSGEIEQESRARSDPIVNGASSGA